MGLALDILQDLFSVLEYESWTDDEGMNYCNVLQMDQCSQVQADTRHGIKIPSTYIPC